MIYPNWRPAPCNLSPMQDLFTQFGIQPVLLIAQIVNFSVLAIVLTKFLYKPIIRAIDTRRDKIEKSLAQVKHLDEQQQKAAVTIEKQLADARKQAEEIMATAKKGAEVKRAEILVLAQKEAHDVLNKAFVQRERDKEQMEAEIQAKVGTLAIAIAEKLLRKHVSAKELESHLQEAIQSVKQQ